MDQISSPEKQLNIGRYDIIHRKLVNIRTSYAQYRTQIVPTILKSIFTKLPRYTNVNTINLKPH